jgi:hypothetical protein
MSWNAPVHRGYHVSSEHNRFDSRYNLPGCGGGYKVLATANGFVTPDIYKRGKEVAKWNL